MSFRWIDGIGSWPAIPEMDEEPDCLVFALAPDAEPILSVLDRRGILAAWVAESHLLEDHVELPYIDTKDGRRFFGLDGISAYSEQVDSV